MTGRSLLDPKTSSKNPETKSSEQKPGLPFLQEMSSRNLLRQGQDAKRNTGSQPPTETKVIIEPKPPTPPVITVTEPQKNLSLSLQNPKEINLETETTLILEGKHAKIVEMDQKQYKLFIKQLQKWKDLISDASVKVKTLGNFTVRHSSISELDTDAAREAKTVIRNKLAPIDSSLSKVFKCLDNYFTIHLAKAKSHPKTGIPMIETLPIAQIYGVLKNELPKINAQLPRGCFDRIFRSHDGFAAQDVLQKIQLGMQNIVKGWVEGVIKDKHRFWTEQPGHRVIADTTELLSPTSQPK